MDWEDKIKQDFAIDSICFVECCVYFIDYDPYLWDKGCKKYRKLQERVIDPNINWGMSISFPDHYFWCFHGDGYKKNLNRRIK